MCRYMDTNVLCHGTNIWLVLNIITVCGSGMRQASRASDIFPPNSNIILANARACLCTNCFKSASYLNLSSLFYKYIM